MTDGGTASPSIPSPHDADSYDEMLDTLDTAIAECERKIESGRVRDAENEKVRIKWIRALGYLVNIRRQVQNDADLKEIKARLDAAGIEVP